MIVLDASAAVDWLLQTSAGQGIEKRIYSRNETLHAPHLLDLEVTQVLRRLALQGVVPAHRADEAVRDLLDLRITQVSSSRAPTPHLATPSQFFCLRCCLRRACRKTRSCASYTGRPTRFCFGPCGSHRALLIRRTASLPHAFIVDHFGDARRLIGRQSIFAAARASGFCGKMVRQRS